MIDTRDPLTVDERAEPTEWEGYADSWNSGGER
jgi:hypothetical protein